MLTNLPLACWVLMDFQRHDLAETNDQNPRPRTLTVRHIKTSLKNFNNWYDLIQQSQEGHKDQLLHQGYGMPNRMKNWCWWDTYICICKELLITDGGLKTDTNIGSNGDGSSLEVPRTLDLWDSRPVFYSLGKWSQLVHTWPNLKWLYLDLDWKTKFFKGLRHKQTNSCRK